MALLGNSVLGRPAWLRPARLGSARLRGSRAAPDWLLLVRAPCWFVLFLPSRLWFVIGLGAWLRSCRGSVLVRGSWFVFGFRRIVPAPEFPSGSGSAVGFVAPAFPQLWITFPHVQKSGLARPAGSRSGSFVLSGLASVDWLGSMAPCWFPSGSVLVPVPACRSSVPARFSACAKACAIVQKSGSVPCSFRRSWFALRVDLFSLLALWFRSGTVGVLAVAPCGLKKSPTRPFWASRRVFYRFRFLVGLVAPIFASGGAGLRLAPERKGPPFGGFSVRWVSPIWSRRCRLR